MASNYTKIELSEMQEVELRDVWPHEASNFTNWLAEEDNLKKLSDEIGIDIELPKKEAPVGIFSVDILAQEVGSDRKIVIENQLEKTDHDHLGKIITYASGYDAEILIWIVKEAQDEHKQAANWLNEHTSTKVNLFVVEMEVWKIADSPPAPKFHVVVQPNDWQKSVKSASESNQLSTTQMQQLRFWTGFNDYAKVRQTKIKLRKPPPRHWCNLSIGSSEASLALTVKSAFKSIGCEIYIGDYAEMYDALYEQKEAIESELQELAGVLTWDGPTQQKKKAKILLTTDVSEDCNFRQGETTWEKHHEWMLTAAEKFQQVFTPRIEEFKRENK